MVVAELILNYEKELEEINKNIETVVSDLKRKHFASFREYKTIDFKKETAIYSDYLKELFKKQKIEILEYSDSHYRNIIQKALHKKPPFAEKDRGFKDAVIWESVKQAFIEEWKVKKEVPEDFDIPVRQGLQMIGDGFRKIREKIWINKTFAKKGIPLIISDVRYPNEFKRIKQEGGINILIGRPDFLSDDPNPSEALIRPYVEWCLKNLEQPVTLLDSVIKETAPDGIKDFHIFIRNDSSLEEFYQRIDRVVVPYVEAYQFLER
jgi:hypothetical protein